MKKIITTSIIIFVGLIAGGNLAYAASAVLSVSPLSSSVNIGLPFEVMANINPNGNSVCVIKGTISFEKLSCQSITLASGLMAQTVPTCSSPEFIIGIPKCSSALKNLFSISVKGSEAGQASLSYAGVKIIGAGTDVVFSSQSGTYNITEVVQEKVSTTTEEQKPVVIPEVVDSTENIGSGLQVPSGIGEFDPIKVVEDISTTSSSSVATTTENENTLVATAVEAFSNVSNKLIASITAVLFMVMAGLYFYNKRKGKYDVDTPDIPRGL